MNPEELLLLKAVKASPDDDLPRLVYCDWLDEHGFGDWAHFIRVQIERAKCPHCCPEPVIFGEHVAAVGPKVHDRRECDRLTEEQAKAFVKLGNVAPSNFQRFEFHRGFAVGAKFSVHEWFGHNGLVGIGPWAMSGHPIKWVEFQDKRPERVGSDYYWHFTRDDSQLHGRAQLPWDLGERMKGPEEMEGWTGQPNSVSRIFDDFNKAIEIASTALVEWADEQELPT